MLFSRMSFTSALFTLKKSRHHASVTCSGVWVRPSSGISGVTQSTAFALSFCFFFFFFFLAVLLLCEEDSAVACFSGDSSLRDCDRVTRLEKDFVRESSDISPSSGLALLLASTDSWMAFCLFAPLRRLMDTASTLDSGDSLRLREEPELDVSSSLSSSRALLVPVEG
jgi:hypothetical protein